MLQDPNQDFQFGYADPQYNDANNPPKPIPPIPGPQEPQASAPAQGGGSPSLPGYSWLDWINKAYGPSASRGSGFADLPGGTSLESVVGRFNQETGGNARYVGGPSGDQVNFGQGNQDVLTAGGQLWLAPGAGGSEGGQPGTGGGAGAGGGGNFGSTYVAPQGGGGQAPTMPTIAPRDPKWDAFYQQLLARSTQGLNVDPNDPVIKAQSDAYNIQSNRALLQQQKAMAERGGQYATGALFNANRMSNEAAGANQAGFLAQTMGREVAARRQEIQDALNGQQGILTAEETSRLHQQDQALASKQAELGWQQQQQDNAFRNAQAATQANQFGQTMSLQQQRAAAQDAQQQWQNQFNQTNWDANLEQQNYDNMYRELFG